LQVLWGQGVRPQTTHAFVEAVAPKDRAGYLADLRALMAQAVARLPGHAEFIRKHCAADS
jgi:tryptophan halogenase